MLPITRRKAFEIPHGLAAIAAIVCLALAFVNDRGAVEEHGHAGRPAPETIEQVVETGQPADRRGMAGQDNRRQPHANLNLMPWLPGPGGNG